VKVANSGLFIGQYGLPALARHGNHIGSILRLWGQFIIKGSRRTDRRTMMVLAAAKLGYLPIFHRIVPFMAGAF